MEKMLEMGKNSATGSFQLLIGVATSTVLMAVGTVILTRILSPAEYGLYTLALVPALVINLFRDWGVNSAMTKYIASLRAAEKETEIRDVIVTGVMFEVATGVALSLLSFVLAGFFAFVLQRPTSTLFISINSITILAGSLLAAAQACFVGFERMKLNSLVMICQAVVKTSAGPLLVIFGYAILGAIVGYMLGLAAAGTIGIVTMYLVLFRPLNKSKVGRYEFSKTLKTMLRYGLPLSISTILSGILTQFYSFMMASYASDTLIGNYHTAVNFSILLTFFTVPISTVLFPVFAKLNPQNEHELVRMVFSSSIKYAAILLVPATIVVMALSAPIVNTLFGEKYVYAPFFLTLYVVSNLYAVVGSVSLSSFLTGLGETKILMKQAIVTLVIGVTLAFILIPPLGILGVIITALVAGVPSMAWGLYWIWKRYKARVEFKSSAKILAASVLAAIPPFLVTKFLHTAPWIQLVIGLAIFLTIYVLGAPAIGAVTLSDIQALRTMFSGISVVSRIVNIPLDVAEKAARIKNSNKT